MNRNTAPRRALAAVLALALLPAPLAVAAKKKPDETAETKKQSDQKAKPKVVKGKLFAIVLGPGPEWEKVQPLKGPGMPEHRRYWARLNDEGRIASAGPLGEDTGLILMRAKNLSDANAAVSADPAVKARLLRGVARPYTAAMTNAEVLEGS